MPATTFREAVETIDGRRADIQEMFGGTRQFGQPGRAGDPNYEQAITEAMTFVEDVQRGRRSADALREAMTTSDFPQLFGDAISRTLLMGYREHPTSWQNYVQRRIVPDFRTTKLYAVDGAEGRLEQVKERGPYPETALSESDYSLVVAKYGKGLSVTFEMIVNDDLGAFSDNGLVARLGKGARRTEEYQAAQLLADANGPNATFWSAGNGNIITGNPALTRDNLQAALTQLSQVTDADGEPIVVEAVELVVPKALELTAREILDTREYRVADGSNVRIISGNGISANLRLSVNPYISTIATTNGDTSWWLIANPDESRPALVLGHLRGHMEPEVFMELSTAQRVGGGVDIVDFEHDAKRYKVRHVLGTSYVDPKPTVASNGSGA